MNSLDLYEKEKTFKSNKENPNGYFLYNQLEKKQNSMISFFNVR